MYQELINEINPKPRFNLKWYKDKDLYTEGEVEDLIIKLIAENEPEDYVQAIYDNYNWSIYYHLTNTRKNIINWYPFNKEASVLEIGCGMGAITSMLCDNCKEVTAVELSKKRATATLLRCREKSNLEIIVGNLNDIEFDKKFDYITLIGVLEYQGSYTETDNPYLDFLKNIKKLLKPNGKLLIAIENQYGLKYWCGAKEDHTGIPFAGINQYKISERKVRTFSKNGLEELIKKSGFKQTYFYYPMPDYKLPTVIYSQNYLPPNENMQNMQCYYAPDGNTVVAQEHEIYRDIVENNVFEFFANSFLVECAQEGDIGQVIFASMRNERLPEYRIGTRFMKNELVEKFPLDKERGKRHIFQTVENENELRKRKLNVWDSNVIDGKITSKFSKEQLWENCLLEAVRNSETEQFYKILDKLYEEVLYSSEEASWETNILYEFNRGLERNKEKYGPILKNAYLDMIPRNAFWVEEKVYWFDQEWKLENVPAKYMLYRALKEFYYSYPEAEKNISLQLVAEHYSLLEIWEEFNKLENLFSKTVIDSKHMAESGGFSGKGLKECILNISKIMGA